MRNSAGCQIDRLAADQVHREFVIWAGGPGDPSKRAPAARWKRDAFYYGLRAFGWAVWGRYRTAEEKAAAA